MTHPVPDISEFLKTCHIRDGCYSIGPFHSDGVTIWKQQVRALNLVHALADSEVIRNTLHDTKHPTGPSKCEIAVVGGGAAGMTAAVACQLLGNDVWHFEQRPGPCHLQAGCDTRWVHPHIYDWPSEGSESPYAALPLLTWQAGTAAEMAKCIIEQYDRYDKIHRLFGATTFVEDGTRVKWDNSGGEGTNQRRWGSREFTIVLIATGFGVEAGVRQGWTHSYWRNDSLNQLQPGITSEKSDHVLVSGTGDGGLIDLLRSKVRGFNQAWLIEELFPAATSIELKKELAGIKAAWSSAHSGAPRTWLFERFDELSCQTAIEHVEERLRDRVRRDVVAILNGCGDVLAESVSLTSASMLNAFLVYLLHRNGLFTYLPGALDNYSSPNALELVPVPKLTAAPPVIPNGCRAPLPPPVPRTVLSVDRVIVRHGTDRDGTLRTLGFAERDLEGLKDRQKSRASTSGSAPLWPAGWWTPQSTGGGVLDRKEFLAAPSEAMASAFASTLARVLMRRAVPPDVAFRLTLHRIIRREDQNYFQQMSPYYGSKGRTSGDPRRFFAVNIGVVGLACRLGRPVALIPSDHWQEIHAALHAGATNVRADSERRCMAAFPLFGESHDLVSMVLYADSTAKFVSSKDTAETIFDAMAGFVEGWRDSFDRGTLEIAPNSFRGFPVPDGGDPHANGLVDQYPDELIMLDQTSEYNRDALTAGKSIHWDCAYRNYAPDPMAVAQADSVSVASKSRERSTSA